MPELLGVLQATGRRKPIGSATEFNRAMNAELSNGSMGARVATFGKSLGTSIVTNAGDAMRRTALRNSIGTLADMFTDPNSVELIRSATQRGAPIGLREAIGRSATQSGITFGEAN